MRTEVSGRESSVFSKNIFGLNAPLLEIPQSDIHPWSHDDLKFPLFFNENLTLSSFSCNSGSVRYIQMLLCDFHIHTTFSDGSLEMGKTVDLFGQAGFDVIAITDHVVNGDNVMGKF